MKVRPFPRVAILVLVALLVATWPGLPRNGAAHAHAGATGSFVAAGTPAPLPTVQGPNGLPSVGISPAAGPPQTVTTVSGANFTPGDTVAILYFDLHVNTPGVPSSLGMATVGADGTLPPTKVTIPAAAATGGIGLLVARGSAPGGNAPVASAIFGVTPLSRDLELLSGVSVAGGLASISATGFQPGASVQVELSDAAGALVAASTPITSTTTGAIGPLALTIPVTATVGIGTVNAEDSQGNVAGVPITILPPTGAQGDQKVLRVQPGRATLGQAIGVAASGFMPGEPVALTVVGAGGTGISVPGLAPFVADGNGMLQGTFVVPAAENVTRVLQASGLGAVGGTNAGTIVTVLLRGGQSNITRTAPLVIAGTRVQLIPSVTVPGHPFSLIGTGFQANERIIVTITDQSGIISQLGVAQTSDTGSFALFSTAPIGRAGGGTSGPPGADYTLTATGQTSNLTAFAKLLINNVPTLTLQPDVAAPGQTVVVQGTAFAPNVTVTINVGIASAAGAKAASDLGFGPPFLASTDANGAFSASITVPITTTAGHHGGVPVPIQARDGSGHQASTVLTINAEPVMVRVTPLPARPGQALTVRGGGFASGETVDIFLAIPTEAASFPSPLPDSIIPAVADAQGAFVASYVLPRPFLEGSYEIGVTGETSGRRAVYPVVVASRNPPGHAPTPVPSTRGSPTPVPAVCGANGGVSVIYLAGGSTASKASAITAGIFGATPYAATVPSPAAAKVGAYGGTSGAVSFAEDLVLLNTGDRTATVTIAYLLYSTRGVARGSVVSTSGADSPGLVALGMASPGDHRTVTFALAPHAVVERSVNADVGEDQVVNVVVRAEDAGQPLAGASCLASGAVRALLVIHRSLIRHPAGTARSVTTATPLDAASTTGLVDATCVAGGGCGSDDAIGPAMHLYFADGNAGTAYAESLILFNPQPSTAHVRVRAITGQHTSSSPLSVSIPAFAQLTVAIRTPRIHGVLPLDLPMSLILDSSVPIVAEQAVFWGAGWGPGKAGFDLSRGEASPRKVTYFAYASTLAGDQANLSILNPASCPPTARRAAAQACARKAEAQLSVTVFSSTGAGYPKGVATDTLRLPAGSRTTIALGTLVDHGIFALMVRSSAPVVSEMAQYVAGGPGGGSHAGLLEPGSSGGTLLTGVGLMAVAANGGTPAPLIRVFNPSRARTVIRVTGMSHAGVYFAQSYQVAAGASLELRLPAPDHQGATPAGWLSTYNRGLVRVARDAEKDLPRARAAAGATVHAGAAGSGAPIGVTIRCSDTCVATSLVGVRAGNGRLASSMPLEVWGGPLF